ncbi:MAG: CoA-binding protein [Promethearchaeota archaeon]
MNNTQENSSTQSINASENQVKNHFLYKILNPESICIFGANNDLLSTMGSMQMRNIRSGFKGKIYPIHLKLPEIQGYKAYKSVLDLPDIPDLAFIILPPHIVPQVLEECGKKGIKRAIITSGGFRESRYSDGIILSKKIDEIAKRYNIRFIGPNCLGVYNGWYGLDTNEHYLMTFWPYHVPDLGKISIISQSGTIAAQTFWQAKKLGVKIGKSISIGNEQNIDMVDILEFCKNDPQTDVIGLYIEEVKRGKEFIKLAEEITPIKPIVGIYAGGTEAATRSIMSHTGAIAGNSKIYEGVFKETGIISTNSVMDFLYYLRTFLYAQLYNVYPSGKRVGIITESGGSATLMTKTCELYGLEVPEFSEELQKEISNYIPYTASGSNPIDVTFFENFYEFFVSLPKLIINSGEVDCILFDGVWDFGEVIKIAKESGSSVNKLHQNFSKVFYSSFLKPLIRLTRKKSIPMFFCGPQLYSYPLYKEFINFDIPIFELWDEAPKCMSILVKYSEYRDRFS